MPQPMTMTINCTRCGAMLSVTDEYLAQYAGQPTTCPTCNQIFNIPSSPPLGAGGPPPGQNSQAAPQPMTIDCARCGAMLSVTDQYLAQYAGQPTTCPTCNQVFNLPSYPPAAPMGTPGAPPMLGYAGPRGYASANVAYDGIGLVMRKGCEGPNRCVKCNAPTEDYFWSKTMYWHPSWLYVLILFPGLLIYAIVALCVRKSGRISVALCPVHRSARNRNMLIAWLICFLGLGMLIGLPILSSSMHHSDADITVAIGVIGGIVVLFGGLVFSAVAVPVLMPRRIDDNFLYLKRAGQPFLESLPPHVPAMPQYR